MTRRADELCGRAPVLPDAAPPPDAPDAPQKASPQASGA
jgi:hypothetical protein